MNPLGLVTEPINKILTPPAEKIGNTLASIWNLTFGWIDHIDEKLKIKRQNDLNKFAEKLELEISKIPLENRIEPKLSIAGPTLEATKYFIEEENMQIMFSKLLANSMNFNTVQYIQNAFVEIIKQMTSVDADNIIDISNIGVLPICQVIENKNSGKSSFNIIHDLLYWHETKNEESWQQNSISLVNLQRLGLIQYDFDTFIIDTNCYRHYSNSKLITSLKSNNQSIELKEGIVKITSYGKQFQKACL